MQICSRKKKLIPSTEGKGLMSIYIHSHSPVLQTFAGTKAELVPLRSVTEPSAIAALRDFSPPAGSPQPRPSLHRGGRARGSRVKSHSLRQVRRPQSFPIRKSPMGVQQRFRCRGGRVVFTSSSLNRRGSTSKELMARSFYAGRLVGLFSDSAACAPTRRIGIVSWRSDGWAVTIVKTNS